jgi:hypothetical protein
MLAARHRAKAHAGHFVTAVHPMFGRCGLMLVMMALNRALASSAAGICVSGESHSAERRAKENNRNQAKNREKRARTIVKATRHCDSVLVSIIRQTNL